jgi:hypothetical protein
MSLLGNLNEVKLADVLRLFATGRKNGRLTISGEDVQAVLRFQKGAIVHALAGRLHGDDAVLDIFGWGEGELTFVPDETQVTPNVTRGVDALILEGLRNGPTLHRMHVLIPSDRVVFQMGQGPSDPSAQCTLGAQEWKVLKRLDGIHDVREVVEATKIPRAEVVRILFELSESGFLERVEPTRALRAVPQGLFGKDAAELDLQIEAEWKHLSRFAEGVSRVEVKSGKGAVVVAATFRSGLGRDVHLPRGILQELGLKEGEDASVRPSS